MKKLMAICASAIMIGCMFTSCGRNDESSAESSMNSDNSASESDSSREDITDKKHSDSSDNGMIDKDGDGIINDAENAGEDIIDGVGDAAEDIIDGVTGSTNPTETASSTQPTTR